MPLLRQKEHGPDSAPRVEYPSRMHAPRVTIPDLARELGLSVGTVSNALSGKGRVAEPTGQRVLDAARRLGYSRNRAAAALRSGRHGVISVYLPTTTTELTFYMEFAFGLSSALAERGVDLLIAAPDGGGADRPVDAVIVVDWSNNSERGAERAAELAACGAPILAVEGVAHGPLTPTMTIAVDYAARIREIVEAALRSGATGATLITCERRLATGTAWLLGVIEGYTQACREAGLEIDHHDFPTDGSPTALAELLDEIRVGSGNDCLVFGSQRVAGLANAVRGYGVPGSPVTWIASSVGDPISELRNDAVTAIDLSANAYGRRCGELALELVGAAESVATPRLDWPAQIKWADHWVSSGVQPAR